MKTSSFITAAAIISILYTVFELNAENVSEKNLSMQLAENPPMQVFTRKPPEPVIPKKWDIRPGFTLVESLDEFRKLIKRDNQKIRLKPGIYTVKSFDKPMKFKVRHVSPGGRQFNEQEHFFAVNGSNNYLDLRGVVIQIPLSLQSKATQRAHVADCWHINGENNVIEGGYFRDLLDVPYPKYRIAGNVFEICNDNTTLKDCTFFVRGSIPYGYGDYYGKGRKHWGLMDKHGVISIDHANNTRIIGCKVYLQAFGHCLHLHSVDGVLIKDCFFTGTLRPTADIFKEVAGRAKEYGFNIMYRGKRPIPKNEVIALTEDGIRNYDNVRNVTIINTTVERMRGCIAMNVSSGDVILENVTVLEAGDQAFDVGCDTTGKIVMKNCRADLAYNPIFNLTRAKQIPKHAFFEVTILSPASNVKPTPRTSIGRICGDSCTFIFHDGTTRPIPEKYFVIYGEGFRKGQALINCTIINETRAKLILGPNSRNCTVKSRGPVVDKGKGNKIVRLE